MSWSSSFVGELSANRLRPRFAAYIVQPANNAGPGGSGEIGEVVSLLTQSGRVTPQSWAATMGGFSLRVATTTPASSLHNIIRRGSICEVRVGWDGWPKGDYEVVARGRVRNVSGTVPELTIECVDLVSSTVSRPASDNIEQQFLFYDAGAPVGPYTATSSGAHYQIDTTFTMSASIDTAMFTRDSSVGKGLLRVEEGTIATYYVTYTGISGADFTGVNSAGSFGTIKPPSTPSGADIRHVPYYRDHPADLVRRVLASTGLGTNGTYDTSPKAWGVAFRDEWIDHGDIDQWRDDLIVATSGSYEWEAKAETRQTSGLSWLTALLSPVGLWLTSRQGQITLRAAQNLYPPAVCSGVLVTDDDIEQVLRYDAWDPGIGYEYGRVKITGPTLSQAQDSTNGVGSRPSGYVKEYDASATHWQNEGAVLAGDRSRLYAWAFVVPERVRLRCAGLRLATLCVGDELQVSSQRLTGRLESGSNTFSYRRALVVGHAVDWLRGSVELELSHPPHHNHTEQG